MLKEFPASLPGNILRRPGCKKGAEEFVSAAAELQHTFKVSIGNSGSASMGKTFLSGLLSHSAQTKTEALWYW